MRITNWRITNHEFRSEGVARFAIRDCLVVFLFAAAVAHARSADDYYHGAAYRYVEGKLQEAGVEAEEGLRRYPGDAKLRALAEQIRKMSDAQRGGSGGGEGDRDEGKDPKKPPRDDSGDENPDDKPRQDSGEGQDPKDAPPSPRDESGRDDGREAPGPGEMSREEAERLLNSFADDEKKEQAERRRAIGRRAGTEQDW